MEMRATKAKGRARQLRSEMPNPERLLWWKLYELNRHSFHFRRQVPIKGYCILCFWNYEVVRDLDGVIQSIVQCAEQRRPPTRRAAQVDLPTRGR